MPKTLTDSSLFFPPGKATDMSEHEANGKTLPVLETACASFCNRFFRTSSFYRVIGPLVGFLALGAAVGNEVATYLNPKSVVGAERIGTIAGAIIGILFSVLLFSLDSRHDKKRCHK